MEQGHGGAEASEFSSQELPTNFVHSRSFWEDPKQVCSNLSETDLKGVNRSVFEH